MDEVLRAERIEIVDKMGNCRAVIGQEEEQFIGLTFYDSTQKKKLNFRIRENGNPEILLYDVSGRLRTKIFVNQRGEPKIMLTDGFDTNIIKLAVSEDDEPVLELRDDSGNTRVGLFITDSGQGGVTVFDDDGNLIGSLPKEADLLEILGTAAKIVGIIRHIAG